MALPAPSDWTLAEYLAYEAEHIGQKPNYEWDGKAPVAMAGATEDHALVCANLLLHIGPQVRRKGCRAVLSDLRVATHNGRRYRYPDLTAYCPPGDFTDDTPPSLLTPILLVEVLSASTARTDAIAKLHEYSQIESLLEYWIVDPEAMSLTRFQFGSALPTFETHVGKSTRFESESLGLTVALTNVFDGLTGHDE